MNKADIWYQKCKQTAEFVKSSLRSQSCTMRLFWVILNHSVRYFGCKEKCTGNVIVLPNYCFKTLKTVWRISLRCVSRVLNCWGLSLHARMNWATEVRATCDDEFRSSVSWTSFWWVNKYSKDEELASHLIIKGKCNLHLME